MIVGSDLPIWLKSEKVLEKEIKAVITNMKVETIKTKFGPKDRVLINCEANKKKYCFTEWDIYPTDLKTGDIVLINATAKDEKMTVTPFLL